MSEASKQEAREWIQRCRENLNNPPAKKPPRKEVF